MLISILRPKAHASCVLSPDLVAALKRAIASDPVEIELHCTQGGEVRPAVVFITAGY